MDLGWAGGKAARYEQQDFVAEAIGVTPGQLREAIVLADGGSGATLVYLNVKVRQPGSPRNMPLKPDSLLSRTAENLGVDAKALQNAILASRPNARPGQTVGIGIRIGNSDQEYTRSALDKIMAATKAAEGGDRWAREFLRLAYVVRDLARKL